MNCNLRPRAHSHPLVVVALALAMAAAGGCGAPEEGRVDATRTPERAEQTLRLVLDAWKAGQKPDALQRGAEAIAVHDSIWRSGKTLADYTIQGRTDGDVRTDFKVHLVLSNPSKEVDQTYYVWGKTPLSVYREEDFMRILATDRP